MNDSIHPILLILSISVEQVTNESKALMRNALEEVKFLLYLYLLCTIMLEPVYIDS